MSRSDDIAREYLKASGGNMTSAIHRMAATICNARDRVEDLLPDKGAGAHDLALLWGDLHPKARSPTGASEIHDQ